MLMKDFQILSCHPGNDDIMPTDKHTETECSMKNKVSRAQVSQTLLLCLTLIPPWFPLSFSQATLSFLFALSLYLGRVSWISPIHTPTLLFCCSALLSLPANCSDTLLEAAFPVPRTHIQCSGVDQLLLTSFYCIFLLQISISMDCCGLLSTKSGYWCFSTVEKLPLLKKIGTHAPDETSQDKSQHETYQASLLRRRQIMKQTQRKQYCCNLLYIRTSESVLELIWL